MECRWVWAMGTILRWAGQKEIMIKLESDGQKKDGIQSVLDKCKLYCLIGKPTWQKPHESCRHVWDDINSIEPEEVERESTERIHVTQGWDHWGIFWSQRLQRIGSIRSISFPRETLVSEISWARSSLGTAVPSNTGSSKKMDGIWNRYNLKSIWLIYTFRVLKCSEKFKVLDLP